MKRYLFVFFLPALIIAGCKNNNIGIKGKLENPKTGTFLYLEELKSSSLVKVDSAEVSGDGSFSFSRRINSPAFYLLMTDQSNFLTMLLEPGQNVEMRGFYDSLNYPALITGSRGTSLMIEYNKELQKTIRKLSGLRAIYLQSLDKPELPLVMDRLDSTAQSYLREINSYTRNYIDENLNSLVSLVALYQQVAPREYVLSRDKDFRYFIKVDSALYPLYPDYDPVRQLHNEVAEMISSMGALDANSVLPVPGSMAPDIALPGPSGDTVRLSSTRGKIVLLDFWASWCAPCRQENPNLVKAYATYHGRGFEIFQVSLDKSKDAWIKGIREDNLDKWIHASDIKYWNSAVVPLYRIERIPANFLLDKDGRIIARDLRGEALQQKLAEVLNKQ